MAVQYRCRNNECREWYDKSLGACPRCGTKPHRYNRWLRTAGLNSHLFQQAENASNPRQERISAYQAAKEFVAEAL